MKRLCIVIALLVGLVSCRTRSTVGSQHVAAETELALAIMARAKADYMSALQHAEKAVSLDPKMTKGHVALGIIADEMCIPNALTATDNTICSLAVQEYKAALALDPNEVDVLKNLAYLQYQRYRLNESEEYYRKGLALKADDLDLSCGVAIFDYGRARADLTFNGQRALPPKGNSIHVTSCRAIRDKNWARVEEGIALMSRAQIAKSNAPDLMEHLAYLYAVRAAMQCEDPKMYESDLAASRTWNHKARELSESGTQRDFLQKCAPASPPFPD